MYTAVLCAQRLLLIVYTNSRPINEILRLENRRLGIYTYICNDNCTKGMMMMMLAMNK